jgi:hypothetical protein
MYIYIIICLDLKNCYWKLGSSSHANLPDGNGTHGILIKPKENTMEIEFWDIFGINGTAGEPTIMSLSLFMFIHLSIHLYLYMHIHIYIYTYVCMYIPSGMHIPNDQWYDMGHGVVLREWSNLPRTQWLIIICPLNKAFIVIGDIFGFCSSRQEVAILLNLVGSSQSTIDNY